MICASFVWNVVDDELYFLRKVICNEIGCICSILSLFSYLRWISVSTAYILDCFLCNLIQLFSARLLNNLNKMDLFCP